MKKSSEEKLLEAIEKQAEEDDQNEDERVEMSSIDTDQLETAAKRMKDNLETRNEEK